MSCFIQGQTSRIATARCHATGRLKRWTTMRVSPTKIILCRIVLLYLTNSHQRKFLIHFNTEYDDYYGAFDDEDDLGLDEDDFESKYLSSGIDLKIDESNNSSKNNEQPLKQQQFDAEETSHLTPSSISQVHALDSSITSVSNLSSPTCLDHDKSSLHVPSPSTASAQTKQFKGDSSISIGSEHRAQSNITSDLTRIAIQHLDKYQWQLPLLEMDQKFRDRTYYKHYSDFYITSLRSKLGHFLADNHLLTNPMRYYMQKELDNYQKYSKMFDLLTEYYQSLGSNFFSFATPSPDEAIVIGCRLGTKGYYHKLFVVKYCCCCSRSIRI